MLCRLFSAKPLFNPWEKTLYQNFWNLFENTDIFNQQNVFENVVRKISAIF